MKKIEMKYPAKGFLVLNFLVSFFICINCCGQFEPDTTETQIANIKKECVRINADTTRYQVVERDIMDQSAEGGFVRLYSDERNLRKAILTLYGEDAKSITEYYLLNGEVIFCFETVLRYNKPMYEENVEVASREENSIYLKNKKIIQWNSGEHAMVSRQFYPEKEKEIIEFLRLFR